MKKTEYTDIKIKLLENVSTLEEIQTQLALITNNFSELTKTVDFKNFDYSHDIKKFDYDTQNKLWILRTILFYQIAIVSIFIMSQKTLFDKVYQKYSNNKRDFMDGIVFEKFEMAIFGSITPTSDIDVSVVNNSDKPKCLSYIISVLEDLFVIFTEKKSLDFDIEYYADILTIKNPVYNPKENSPDIYILDTVNFDEKNFNELLPYAFASMIRNVHLSFDNTKIDDDKFNRLIFEHIKKFDYKQYNDYYDTNGNGEVGNGNYDFNDVMNRIKIDSDNFENSFNQGLIMVKKYLKSSYDNGRNEYYQLINRAEGNFYQLKTLFNTEYEKNKTDPNWQQIIKTELEKNKQLILDTIKSTAIMDIFRKESYVCAPTIMHVVRVIQATKNKSNIKYPVTYPQCLVQNTPVLEGAVCEIGKYGYMLSIFEQIGYVLRFENEYCNTETSAVNDNCTKKIKKYMERYIDAVNRLDKITQTSSGGKRRRTCKKKSKKSSVKKSKTYRKNTKKDKN